MAASLALMTMDHRQHHLQSIRADLSLVVYPLQYVVNIPAAVGNWASETLATRDKLLEENRRLRERELLQQMRHALPTNACIVGGGLLGTSGLGRHFPPGSPVATIATIKSDQTQRFAHVVATPMAHLERSREVLLVSQQSAVEPKPAAPVTERIKR